MSNLIKTTLYQYILSNLIFYIILDLTKSMSNLYKISNSSQKYKHIISMVGDRDRG